MASVKTHFEPERIAYDGSQLRSHWILERFGLVGDAAAAFVGPCDVKLAHMIDVEDRRAALRIASKEMLHFVVEHFDADLDLTILRQRLLICRMADALNERLGERRVRRNGSDLYDGEAKLTVSIATATPVSTLVHAGINVLSEGTPVATRGLADYGVAAAGFAAEVLDRYAEEMASAYHARCKARAGKSE